MQTLPRPESQTVSVEYAAAALGIGRNTLYQAIKRGEVPCLRIGRRCVIRRSTLTRLLSDGGPFPPTTEQRDGSNVA